MSAVLQARKRLVLVMDNLNAREQLYVEARTLGSPPVVCARIAGFDDPDKDALRLESNPVIHEAIRAHIQTERAGTIVSREDVLQGFLDAVRMSATATELTGAWREIGKLTGAYEPKKVELTYRNAESLRQMSDDELLQAAAIEGEYVDLADEDPDLDV